MSKIDLQKLTNVVVKDGKTVARCPACAARGDDAKGNNLVVFLDGKFGCIAYPSDREHNRQIFGLVGAKARTTIGRVAVRRISHPPSTTIKVVGHLGREISTAPKKSAVDGQSGTRSEKTDGSDGHYGHEIPTAPGICAIADGERKGDKEIEDNKNFPGVQKHCPKCPNNIDTHPLQLRDDEEGRRDDKILQAVENHCPKRPADINSLSPSGETKAPEKWWVFEMLEAKGYQQQPDGRYVDPRTGKTVGRGIPPVTLSVA